MLAFLPITVCVFNLAYAAQQQQFSQLSTPNEDIESNLPDDWVMIESESDYSQTDSVTEEAKSFNSLAEWLMGRKKSSDNNPLRALTSMYLASLEQQRKEHVIDRVVFLKGGLEEIKIIDDYKPDCGDAEEKTVASKLSPVEMETATTPSSSVETKSTFQESVPIQSDYRQCEPFSSILVYAAVSVELVPGDSYALRIEGQSDEHTVVAKVYHGHLLVDTENDAPTRRSSGKVKVLVQVPSENGNDNSSISRIGVGGHANLSSSLTLKASNLRLDARGEGSIWANVKCDQLSVYVAWAGKAQISGTCDHMQAHVEGTGTLDAVRLISENVNMTMLGGGHARVHARSSLVGHVSGLASLRYCGDPTAVSVQLSQLGDVSRI